MLTLVPAYGRDYKTAAEVKRDWVKPVDFIISNYFHAGDGKPMSRNDAKPGETFLIRYDRLMKTVVVSLKTTAPKPRPKPARVPFDYARLDKVSIPFSGQKKPPRMLRHEYQIHNNKGNPSGDPEWETVLGWKCNAVIAVRKCPLLKGWVLDCVMPGKARGLRLTSRTFRTKRDASIVAERAYVSIPHEGWEFVNDTGWFKSETDHSKTVYSAITGR